MPIAASLPGIVKVGGAIIGGISAKKTAKSANKRGDELSAAAVNSANQLQATADRLSSIAEDRWNFYVDHGQNVDVMLIDDAVQLFKETFSGGSDRAAARAAEDVAAAFDRSAEVRRRAALRFGGVDPSSGKFQGLERETAIARATTEASARFKARRTEEDRARQILGNASDVANRAIGQAGQFEQLGIFADNSAARIFSGQVPDARADAAGSAALVGDIAGKIPFERLFSDKSDSDKSDSDKSDSDKSDSDKSDSEPAVTESKSEPDAAPTEVGRKHGGKVPGYRTGGAIPNDGRGGGRIIGPGTGTSDSVPAVVDGTRQPIKLSAGEFIIPERVVRQKGERFFNQMIRR